MGQRPGSLPPEISLIICAPPFKHASATEALYVSTETKNFLFTSFFTTGRTRFNSSFSLITSLPGLELSPPTSMRNAPSLTICSAIDTAWYTSRVPSPEKLSGVQLITPINKGEERSTSFFPSFKRMHNLSYKVQRTKAHY